VTIDHHPGTPGDAPGVLLLGNYRPTLTLVRDLKSLGWVTIVGRGGGEGGAEYSRFTDEVWEHPPLEDGREAFLGALGAFLGRRSDIGVVLPVAEEFVRAVSAARDRLPSDRIYALPEPQVVRTALDKTAVWGLAQSIGVPVASHALATSYADLERRCDEIGYPLVIRPLDSTRRLGEVKALIVVGPAELASTMPAWPGGHTGLLVQRRVTGRRHNLYFAARRGRIVRLLETVIERTDHVDGTGLAVEGRTVATTPVLARHTERLAGCLGYSGVGCAQFLVDPEADGVTFLELNPRVAGNHAVAEAAGLELGRLSILLASPEPPDVPFVAGTPGLVYAWTYGDVRGLVHSLRRGLPAREALRWLGHVLRALLRADVHMTWRWDDPLPTLALFGVQLPVLRRLLHRRVGVPLGLKTSASPTR